MQKISALLHRNDIKSMYYVYILRCSDDTLYTGITTDPERRLKQHNSGTAAKYTRSRRPVEMVYKETALGKSEALKRELEIKALSRNQKLELVRRA